VKLAHLHEELDYRHGKHELGDPASRGEVGIRERHSLGKCNPNELRFPTGDRKEAVCWNV
jgi:hypothetical protein